jgi:hypothetical protein
MIAGMVLFCETLEICRVGAQPRRWQRRLDRRLAGTEAAQNECGPFLQSTNVIFVAAIHSQLVLEIRKLFFLVQAKIGKFVFNLPDKDCPAGAFFAFDKRIKH